jgi:hypothetical protein
MARSEWPSNPRTKPSSGWWLTYPSEKYESQLGGLFLIIPNIWKMKNVPNHQPDNLAMQQWRLKRLDQQNFISKHLKMFPAIHLEGKGNAGFLSMVSVTC